MPGPHVEDGEKRQQGKAGATSEHGLASDPSWVVPACLSKQLPTAKLKEACVYVHTSRYTGITESLLDKTKASSWKAGLVNLLQYVYVQLSTITTHLKFCPKKSLWACTGKASILYMAQNKS